MITLAVTMGDPAGIGPWVALQAAAPESIRLVLVGDAVWLRRLARRHRLPWPWTVVGRPVTGPRAPRRQVWDVVRVPAGVRPGRVQAAAGRAAWTALECAITLAQVGQADALVTAPVSKEAISRVHPGWTGHTEHVARACGVRHPLMLFAAGPLRIGLVTTHQSLAQVVRLLTPARVARVVRQTVAALRDDFGLPQPRVGVAALNPHAGEGGLLGTEESRWLAPLIRRLARQAPAVLSGPHPADTLFRQHARGAYDAVVALYHDQALIPIKLVAWEHAVNVTLGLPFVRTSPAHGTAFDLARALAGEGRSRDASSIPLAAPPGQRTPDHRSMQAALDLAVRLARHRHAHARPH